MKSYILDDTEQSRRQVKILEGVIQNSLTDLPDILDENLYSDSLIEYYSVFENRFIILDMFQNSFSELKNIVDEFEKNVIIVCEFNSPWKKAFTEFNMNVFNGKEKITIIEKSKFAKLSHSDNSEILNSLKNHYYGLAILDVNTSFLPVNIMRLFSFFQKKIILNLDLFHTNMNSPNKEYNIDEFYKSFNNLAKNFTNLYPDKAFLMDLARYRIHNRSMKNTSYYFTPDVMYLSNLENNITDNIFKYMNSIGIYTKYFEKYNDKKMQTDIKR